VDALSEPNQSILLICDLPQCPRWFPASSRLCARRLACAGMCLEQVRQLGRSVCCPRRLVLGAHLASKLPYVPWLTLVTACPCRSATRRVTNASRPPGSSWRAGVSHQIEGMSQKCAARGEWLDGWDVACMPWHAPPPGALWGVGIVFSCLLGPHCFTGCCPPATGEYGNDR